MNVYGFFKITVLLPAFFQINSVRPLHGAVGVSTNKLILQGERAILFPS